MMDWSKKWEEAATIKASRKGWNLFEESSFSQWYEIQLEHNSYPGTMIEKIESQLSPSSTLLEVGAGTGAFTVPLAEKIKSVTAVEPSNAMSAILFKKMGDLKNIKVIGKKWEELDEQEIGMHDMVLAANSLYSIKDIRSALLKMMSLAKKYLYIIVGFRSGFYKDIWNKFKGQDYDIPPRFIHIYNILYEMGVNAEIEVINTDYTYLYQSLDQAVRYWSYRLDLEETAIQDLNYYLKSRLKSDNGHLFFDEKTCYAIITHEKNGCIYH